MLKILKLSLERGEKNLSKIAATHADQLELSEEKCQEYLEKIICFRLGEGELEALQLFEQMLAENRP